MLDKGNQGLPVSSLNDFPRLQSEFGGRNAKKVQRSIFWLCLQSISKRRIEIIELIQAKLNNTFNNSNFLLNSVTWVDLSKSPKKLALAPAFTSNPAPTSTQPPKDVEVLTSVEGPAGGKAGVVSSEPSLLASVAMDLKEFPRGLILYSSVEIICRG